VGEGNAFVERVRTERKALTEETVSILIQHLLFIYGMKYLSALVHTNQVYNTGKFYSKLCSICYSKNYETWLAVRPFE